jgi:hypothetical protein
MLVVFPACLFLTRFWENKIIISDFFETLQELDVFLLELPKGSFVKIVNGKLNVIVGSAIAVVHNRFYEISSGKVVKIINPLKSLLEEKPKRKRH